MKLSARVIQHLGVLLFLLACAAGVGHAADLSQPVVLVATERLAGSGYHETVLVAAPLPAEGHFGFIVNRPTNVKLETAFPEHAPSRKVVDPLYLGGPVLAETMFAVARRAPDGGHVIPLMPGLVAVFDGKTLLRVIDTTPNDARYFAGVMIWTEGELDDEIRAGKWEVRPPDVGAVFHANPAGLWEELSRGGRPDDRNRARVLSVCPDPCAWPEA